MSELKSCPFCGAASEDIETVYMGSGLAYIRCSKCLSRCGMRDGVDAAERLWNKRKIPALIEELCSAIGPSIAADEEAEEAYEELCNVIDELNYSTKLFVMRIIAESIKENFAAIKKGG